MSQLDRSKVNKGPDEAEHERVELELRSRERYLALLNDMTRTILLSEDFDSTLGTLAVDLAKLINADDCYITRWDEEKQVTIPTTTTAKLDIPYSTRIN
jgi:transcriptional regulator with GAF, ATPase, and Fis domain